jgi:hypothetical protein
MYVPRIVIRYFVPATKWVELNTRFTKLVEAEVISESWRGSEPDAATPPRVALVTVTACAVAAPALRIGRNTVKLPFPPDTAGAPDWRAIVCPKDVLAENAANKRHVSANSFRPRQGMCIIGFSPQKN